MATYVILSRFSPEAFGDPKEFKKLAEDVSSKIKMECPGVTWKESLATRGRFDVVDVVEAQDTKEIEKAAMIIRAYGHSTTETLIATPWKEFEGCSSLVSVSEKIDPPIHRGCVPST